MDFNDDDLEFDPHSVAGVSGAVDKMIDDCRQLSSDFDSLKLGISPLKENVQPKKETKGSCMFSEDSAGFIPASTGFIPAPTGETFMQQQQHLPGELRTGYVQPSAFSQQNPLFSCNDLEMDNAPSMMSFVKSPPQGDYKPSIERDILAPKSISQYGYYGDVSLVQSQDQIQCRGETFLSAVAMDTETAYPALNFQQDELGDCALHTLSEVSDTTLMANILASVQNSNKLPEMLNLQNKHKQTPLFLAVLVMNIPLIGWLLDRGADPNIQGTLPVGRHEYFWRAPLHLVAMKGDSAIHVFQLLFEKCRNLNLNLLSIGDKLTPLHMALKTHSTYPAAAQLKCNQLVKELVRRGADVGIRDQASSKTPLILAVETRDLDFIKQYLELFTADRRRALLQDKTRSGDTCLHIAAGLSRFPSHEKEILLRLLVMNGANGNTANNAKELPRDFARTEWDRIKS